MNAAIAPPTAWTTGSTEVFKTGTWRASLPRHISAPSPCHAACPVEGDIAHWIGRVREGDMRGAWDILVRNNPFPAVAGRVCHHPCETDCNRRGFDGALSICRLERYVGDQALSAAWALPSPEVERAERIAVVGGGPSGLAAAYHLRRRGYRVTIVEACTHLGGLMREGIPAYRLPRAVLDGEIGRIVALGVELRLGAPLESPAGLARLRSEFDAVYLATGARRQKRLPQLDYGKPWAIDGADWLARANAAAPPALGRRLVVIGGGSAAIDVARSARRLGHDVRLVALEREAQMPAQRDEIEEALEEGVLLTDGAMLERVVERPGGALALECLRVEFFAGSDRATFRVEPIADSGFVIEADAVVSAIGQDPELSILGDALARNGALLAVDARQATRQAGVYAGGDLTSMARFITEAIGMGKRAAIEIDAALAARAGREPEQVAGTEAQRTPAGARLSSQGARSTRVVAAEAIATFYYPPHGRAPGLRLQASERLSSDAEVQLGFDAGQALAESERCFSCGNCILCDNCVAFCPDMAVRRVDGGYAVNGDYCKGCGICVRECPTGSIEMVEELR